MSPLPQLNTYDSTPGEDTPIRSNSIMRMFISLLVFMVLMAYILLSIGFVNHCDLPRVFERVPEVMEGNYYQYILEASMSNQLSTELAVVSKSNAESIDDLNQPINNGSSLNEPSLNEPQNNHADLQLNSNTQFNPGEHAHQPTVQGGINQNYSYKKQPENEMKIQLNDELNGLSNPHNKQNTKINSHTNLQPQEIDFPIHNQINNNNAINASYQSNTTPLNTCGDSQNKIHKNVTSTQIIGDPAQGKHFFLLAQALTDQMWSSNNLLSNDKSATKLDQLLHDIFLYSLHIKEPEIYAVFATLVCDMDGLDYGTIAVPLFNMLLCIFKRCFIKRQYTFSGGLFIGSLIEVLQQTMCY